MSDILEKLVKEDNLLMAYQICFDLYESASQQFLSSVIQNLRTVGTPIPAVPGSTNTGTVPTQEKDRWETEGMLLLPKLCIVDLCRGGQYGQKYYHDIFDHICRYLVSQY